MRSWASILPKLVFCGAKRQNRQGFQFPLVVMDLFNLWWIRGLLGNMFRRVLGVRLLGVAGATWRNDNLTFAYRHFDCKKDSGSLEF